MQYGYSDAADDLPDFGAVVTIKAVFDFCRCGYYVGCGSVGVRGVGKNMLQVNGVERFQWDALRTHLMSHRADRVFALLLTRFYRLGLICATAGLSHAY